MKILWISNSILTNDETGKTGTWLGAMAQRLILSQQVTLGNVTMGNVRELTSRDCQPVRQWLVPPTPSGKNGFPPRKVVDMVTDAIKLFSPDLIHIWGVEAWWGLLAARGLIKLPVLLEMQGIKGVYSRVFAGGLTLKEQRKCYGPKELILRRSINKERRKFAAWGSFEKEIIGGCHNVTTQTPWVEAWVHVANPGCKTYKTDLMLRQQFCDAAVWSPSTKEPVLFCSAAYAVPYKGLHDAIRTTALLSRRFPKIRLRIAGAHQRTGIRQDGYVRWLNNLCFDLGIASQIEWLGALSAELIVKEIQDCSVFIMPSHCETYCVALAEAMYLGCPSVIAFNGGTSWIVSDNKTGLFYPPGDEAMCCYQIERLLTDRDLGARLSHNARSVALKRNDPAKIVANQLAIYQQILSENEVR
jgi:glycosyltransferase involved in cell wall biosynthesis